MRIPSLTQVEFISFQTSISSSLSSMSILILWGLLSLLNWSLGLDTTVSNEQPISCLGMYPGNESPNVISFALVSDLKPTDHIKYLVYLHQDDNKLGYKDPESGRKQYICDDTAIELGKCQATHKGDFIVADHQPHDSIEMGEIKSQSLPHQVEYKTFKGGYYCVRFLSTSDFKVDVNFHSGHGYIPPHSIKSLYLSRLLSLAYIALAITYGMAAFKNHNRFQYVIEKYFSLVLGFIAFSTVVDCMVLETINRDPHDDGIMSIVMVVLSLCVDAIKWSLIYSGVLIISSGAGYKQSLMPITKSTRDFMIQYNLNVFNATGWFLSTCYLKIYSDDTEMGLITKKSLWSSILWVLTTCFTGYYLYGLFQRLMNHLRETERFDLVKTTVRLYYGIIGYGILFIMGEGWWYVQDLSMKRNGAIEDEWKLRYYFCDFYPGILLLAVMIVFSMILKPQPNDYTPLTADIIQKGDEQQGQPQDIQSQDIPLHHV